MLKYNETIDYPVDLTREGYTFNGWVPNLERMPAKNTTVTAQWTATVPPIVEVVIGTKEVDKKEIEKIIQGFTDENFTIEVIEVVEDTGKVKVIIRFNEPNHAMNFVEAIESSSNSGPTIETIGFLSEVPLSFSPKAHYLFSFLSFLIITLLFF